MMLCTGFWMLDDKTSVGPRSPLAATIPLSALYSSLPSNYVIKILGTCETRRDRRWARQPGSVLHDALERGSCLRGFRRWRRNGAQSTGPAL
jgi:hypothetical protein